MLKRLVSSFEAAEIESVGFLQRLLGVLALVLMLRGRWIPDSSPFS